MLINILVVSPAVRYSAGMFLITPVEGGYALEKRQTKYKY